MGRVFFISYSTPFVPQPPCKEQIKGWKLLLFQGPAKTVRIQPAVREVLIPFRSQYFPHYIINRKPVNYHSSAENCTGKSQTVHAGKQQVPTILLHILMVHLPHHFINNHCLTRLFIAPSRCSALNIRAAKSPLFYKMLVLTFYQQRKTAGEKIRHPLRKLN